MKLSILIPVYNEASTVEELVKQVESVKIPLEKELVIVDDYSTDGTRDALKKLQGEGRKIIFHKRNGGKGRAVRTALQHATGELFIIQDADLEYDPREYQTLLKPILNGAEVVYGSRFLGRRFFSPQRWGIPSHYIGNRFLSLLTSLLYFQYVTDMETCYKMFTRTALERIHPLRAQRFDLEPELTAKFLKAGFKIYEVPISYHPRDFDEGKKISWRDGVTATFVLIKSRFCS